MIASLYQAASSHPFSIPASINLSPRSVLVRAGSRAPAWSAGRVRGYTPGFSGGALSGLASDAQHTSASPRVNNEGSSRGGLRAGHAPRRGALSPVVFGQDR